MESLFHARSVDPTAVTDDDLAAIHAEFDLDVTGPGPADFFRPGTAYVFDRYGIRDVFRCASVGTLPNGLPAALGYAPINLAAGRTWEVVFTTRHDWAHGWTEDPTAAPAADAALARPATTEGR